MGFTLESLIYAQENLTTSDCQGNDQLSIGTQWYLSSQTESFLQFWWQTKWTRTKSNSGVMITVDLIGKFDLVLMQFGLQSCGENELMNRGITVYECLMYLTRACCFNFQAYVIIHTRQGQQLFWPASINVWDLFLVSV